MHKRQKAIKGKARSGQTYIGMNRPVTNFPLTDVVIPPRLTATGGSPYVVSEANSAP
jgi:hypothetical protein